MVIRFVLQAAGVAVTVAGAGVAGGNPAHAPGEVTGLGLAVVRVADMPPAFDQVPTL